MNQPLPPSAMPGVREKALDLLDSWSAVPDVIEDAIGDMPPALKKVIAELVDRAIYHGTDGDTAELGRLVMAHLIDYVNNEAAARV